MTTNAMETKSALPGWAEQIRRRYLRGESSLFVVFGNVNDVILHEGKLLTVSEVLGQVLFGPNKDTVALYNISTGVRFLKRKLDFTGIEELLVAREPSKVLPLLERAMTSHDRVAVILEHAETIAPQSDPSLSMMDDRAAVVTLQRWSLLQSIERGDSIIVAIVENLSELHAKIVSNPRVSTISIPMPSKLERQQIINFTDPSLEPAEVERLSEITAGLKSIQIASILTPAGSEDLDSDREHYLVELLAEGAQPTAEVRDRAARLVKMTKGMSREEVRKLLLPHGKKPEPRRELDGEVEHLVAQRKREIIERECFGLVEFVEPSHGFEVVGGMEEIKADLLLIAENMREGRRNRCPMGMLFTGPMGTGKTFVAEAFAKECGLTAIKLKNFRSKWVGATEGNLERILTVLKAMGQVVVLIDEGDRSFGGGGGGDEGDGGTSSRVIARMKEFMSDTDNRGRVLFILMTNRPDKLDVDLKRAGRLDRKIPFLYPQEPDDVERVLFAQFRKAKVTYEGAVPLESTLTQRLLGYSNADLESVVLLSVEHAAATRGTDSIVQPADLERAVFDYLPSRDVKMIEYMELLAVFEASNRRMLPKKYANVPIEQLQDRLSVLRLECQNRR